MGADGHLVAVTRESFDANCQGITPDDLSLYSGKILGVEAVWSYSDQDHDLPWTDFGGRFDITSLANSWRYEHGQEITDAERASLKAAAEWFEANAEYTEVWT